LPVVPEVPCAFLWCEGAEGFADAVPQGLGAAFGGLARQCFELGEGKPDQVEVGRTGGR
jgi:hypothetical protein